MSNRNGCSTPGCLIKCLLNNLFGLTVECRGSFIKEQDFGVSNESTSNSDTLLLTTRKLGTFPTDFGVKTIWQGYDKVVLKQESVLFVKNGCETHDVGILAGSINLILSHLLHGLVRTQKNIEPNRTCVKGLKRLSHVLTCMLITYRFLRNKCDLASVIRQVELLNIDAIQSHTASQRVVEPLQHLDGGRLSTTGRTNESHTESEVRKIKRFCSRADLLSASRNINSQIPQYSHSRPGGIPEVNTFNSHMAKDVLMVKHLAFARFSIDGWFVVNGSEDGSGRRIGLGRIRDEGEDVSGLNGRKDLQRMSVKERVHQKKYLQWSSRQYRN